MKRQTHIRALCLLAGAAASSGAALAAEPEHFLEIVGRLNAFTDRNQAFPTSSVPNPSHAKYDQTALGVQVNYRSPFYLNFIGVDASYYGVAKLGDSGVPTSNILDVGNNGKLADQFGTLAVAAVKMKFGETAGLKLGRQLQDSLLLKSTSTRAVPDTYSGISAFVKHLPGLVAYAAAYDQWRSRSSGDFVRFRTETTAAGVANRIDYIAVLGATYKQGPFTLTGEYLNAKDYLSKLGLVGAYSIPLQASNLKLSGGILASRDAGSLFVCGAEREMDCTGTKRIQNDGKGVFVDAEWKRGNFTLGGAVAKFDGFWIEDNFAVNATKAGALTQDHGTNPFPTSSLLGPDLTNNGETVGSIRLGYDWKDYVRGLSTAFKYAHGSGAKSSNLSNTALGSESYRQLDVAYALPYLKGLAARYIYLNYDSHIDNGSPSATIKGMPRQDWIQQRFYIDYTYRF
ncbi:MAG: OprD family outer membrane porin [Proteobacteria bacterium]|nr:OprD family outer membrane porin [Pseudomonadota bacterium]